MKKSSFLRFSGETRKKGEKMKQHLWEIIFLISASFFVGYVVYVFSVA